MTKYATIFMVAPATSKNKLRQPYPSNLLHTLNPKPYRKGYGGACVCERRFRCHGILTSV